MTLLRESRPFEVTFGAGGFLFLVIIGLAVGGGAFGVGYWLGREHGVPIVATPAKPDLSLIRDPLALAGAEKKNATTEAQETQSAETQRKDLADDRRASAETSAGSEARPRDVRREGVQRPSAVSVRPGSTAARRVFTVQVKSLPTRAEADAFAARIRKSGFVPFVVQAEIKKRKWFRVRVGEFATADEAEAARAKLLAIARDAIVSHD